MGRSPRARYRSYVVLWWGAAEQSGRGGWGKEKTTKNAPSSVDLQKLMEDLDRLHEHESTDDPFEMLDIVGGAPSRDQTAAEVSDVEMPTIVKSKRRAMSTDRKVAKEGKLPPITSERQPDDSNRRASFEYGDSDDPRFTHQQGQATTTEDKFETLHGAPNRGDLRLKNRGPGLH